MVNMLFIHHFDAAITKACRTLLLCGGGVSPARREIKRVPIRPVGRMGETAPLLPKRKLSLLQRLWQRNKVL